MLAPDIRTTLTGQIRPPADAKITHLLGTTYTLDLLSALVPPLAVSGSAGLRSSDPLEVLAALRNTAADIDIFHQAGQVPVPAIPSRILTLLEDGIHAVRHRPGFLFHPKIWLARYEYDDDTIGYRLLVQTRNLTPDKSWDVVVTLDGTVMTQPFASNRPLSKLITYLPQTAVVPVNTQRRQRLAALAEEIRHVEWATPAGVRDVRFHVFGVPGLKAAPDFSGYQHLLISPFLGDDGLHYLLDDTASGDVTVVSTDEAFTQLGEVEVLKGAQRRVLAPAAGVPADDEQASSHTILRGLHAKMYCVRRDRRSHLFIGSANATAAAFGGNVEILVELDGNATLGVDALLDEEHGLGGILVPLDDIGEPVDTDDSQRNLDAYLRSVASLQMAVRLSRDGETCRLEVTSEDVLPALPDTTVAIAPLTRPELAQDAASGAPVSLEFNDLALTDTTALLTVRVVDTATQLHSATVVKARLIKDLPGRVSAVIGHEIKTPEALLRLLRLLLAFGSDAAATETEPTAGAQSASRQQLENGLFEMLLQAAAHRPQSLDSIRGIVDDIVSTGDPKNLLPKGFDDMWAAINAAVKETR